MIAVEPGLDLLDSAHIHDGRAMYPEKLLGFRSFSTSVSVWRKICSRIPA